MSTATPTRVIRPEALTDGENRVLVPNVPWSFYDWFVEHLPENSAVSVAYDGKDMEIMTKSQEHEDLAKFLGYLVVELARVLRLPFKGLRETTWKRPLIERGIEADNCFYLDPAKLQQAARAKGKKDLSAIPDPDLAIEVDISPPLTDRPAIYAALGVTELWIFRNGEVTIEILGPDRRYSRVEASHYLKIRADEVTRWLVDEDTSDDLAWLERLATWLRDEWRPAP
jgi:Uma2 family endonuclease